MSKTAAGLIAGKTEPAKLITAFATGHVVATPVFLKKYTYTDKNLSIG